MLRLGSGFAVRDGGRVVATALALPYPPVFGWVSMVLVHTPYRRLGLATRLVERATAALTGAGLLPVLDATARRRGGVRPHGVPARGEPAALARQRAAPVRPPRRSRASPTRVHDLDRAAFGADRGAVLADLSGRPAPVAALAAGGDGYLLSRAGRTATQLGPLVARDRDHRGGAARDRASTPSPAPSWSTCRSGRRPSPRTSPAAASRPSGRSCGWRSAATRSPATPALVHAIAGPELG